MLALRRLFDNGGSTTTAELQVDSSPCIGGQGTNKMNVSTLVEGFNEDDVDIVTYNNETEISDGCIPYEDLAEDTIDEILVLLEEYDVDMNKTMDSTRDEDF